MWLERREQNLQLPEKWIHGIPTQIDVKDKKFQSVLHDEEVNELVHRGLDSLISNVWIYNRVVEAIKVVDGDPFSTQSILDNPNNISKENFSDKFNQEIDFNFILTSVNEKIAKYKEGLKTLTKQDLNRLNKTTGFFSFGASYTYGVLTSKQSGEVSFKPIELIAKVLEDVEELVHELGISSDDDIVKASILYKSFDTEKEAVDALRSGLFYLTPETSFSLINKKGSEANRLSVLNEFIGSRSGTYLRFDGLYLVVREGAVLHNFPFKTIESGELADYALGNRTQLRDHILGRINGKGEVLNGKLLKRLDPKLITYEGNASQWLTNLIGEPIADKSKIVFPEEWASRERKMVEDYRDLSLEEVFNSENEVIHQIRKYYPTFNSEKYSYSLDSLLLRLREADWMKLHE